MKKLNYALFKGLFSLLLLLTFSINLFAAPNSKKQLSLLPSDRHHSGFRKLSDPIQAIEPHYEYAIIGSGYGASVMALRIAEELRAKGLTGKRQVAIFERGREWMPGEFPETAPEMAASVKTPLNPLGFVNIESNIKADMEVISSNALAGTSNMNIAINLRPPENVWEQKEWPEEIRKDFQNGKIEELFQTVEGMLRPNHGPITRSVTKSALHIKTLEAGGIPAGELNLAINHEPGREQNGVRQNACTFCGNCAAGCNVGAKNTLATNYLAKAKGETPDETLQIITQTEVTKFERLNQTTGPNGEKIGPRYLVHYTHYYQDNIAEAKLGIFKKLEGAYTANNIIIGAGSTGSTQLLMRSESNDLKFSDALGTRVSANGDLMGFIYNAKVDTNIVAYENTKSLEMGMKPVGQTISVYGDYRAYNKNEAIEKQFVLLDGAIPASLAPTIAKGLATVKGASMSLSGMKRATHDLISLYPSENGALNHSMLLLACGHDSSSGRYKLDSNNNIYAVWPGMRDEQSFQYIEDQMKEYAKRMGGEYIPNPRAQVYGGGKMPVPHPLGGAPMGSSVENGVVNHAGQVFNPDGGVYDGLYVVDASIIPRSLAAPPLLTISALAERISNIFIQQRMRPCEAALIK